MADTKDFGRFFFYTLKIIPDTPLLHRAPTYEITPPYRESRSFVLRLFPTRIALVLGWWRDTGRTEEEALNVALGGYGIDLYDGPDLDDAEVRAQIRENVASSGLDLDQEWEIIAALGADK